MIWILLALGAPLATAQPSDEALSLADAPTDPVRRLSFAKSLLNRPGWEEAGLDALSNLLGDPIVRRAAQAALADFLSKVEGRPGWARLYASVVAAGPFSGSDIIRVRAAEARALEPATRKRGLAELDVLATTADPVLAKHVGRAFLRAGEAERAALSYGLSGGEGAEGRLLAALAKGDLVTARALAQVGVARAPGVDEALREGSLAARAEALAANGFVEMAARMLEAGSIEEHGRQLAALYQAKARYVEATTVLTRLRRAGLSDAAADRRLAEVYASRRMYHEAIPLVGNDPAFADQLLTLVTFKSAWESRVKSDDGPALAAAWAVAPTDAFIAREWGKARLAEKRADEAMPALGLALDIDPTDPDALGLYGLSAQQLGSTRSIVRRLLLGAAAETSPADRATLMAKAAIYMGMLAEEYKGRESMDDAIETYLIATLLDPAENGKLLGAAGLLWQSQHTGGALALYELVRAKRPDDPDLLLNCVRLTAQLGREEAALELLRRTKMKDPRVTLLRRTIENGIRAREARAAANSGDLEAAAILWRELTDEWPDESEFLHGLADALAGLGQYEEALTAYRRTLALAPSDAWAVLGEANCLIALDRPTEARRHIEAAFVEGIDPSADIERPRALARAWRAEAQTLQSAGKSLEAFAAWREAFELQPEVWATNGLASLYLEHDQPEVALVFYEEAHEMERNPASGVGRAVSLERLGRWDEAIAAADDIVLLDPSDAAALERRGLIQRVTVAQAEYDRRSGRQSAAIARLRRIADVEGSSGEMWSSLTAAYVDVLDCPSALESATLALRVDPKSVWALDVAIRAGAICRAMSELYPHIQEAVAAGGHDPDTQLRSARIELTVQRSENLVKARRPAEAATRLDEAESIGPATPDEWSRIGGAWVGAGEPQRGIDAFQQALLANPHHVPAIIGISGALRAQVHLAAAEAHLQQYYDELADPRIGLQLVQLQIQRGEYRRAEASLSDTKSRSLPVQALPIPASAAPDPLPVLPLPSGNRPEPRTWPPSPPQDLQPRWLVDARESIDIALLRETGVYLSAGLGAFQRPGNAGEQQLFGWYVPVESVFPPIGLLRLNADVMPIFLDDGEDQAAGIATSVGVASPPFRRLFATARLGTSPLGFDQVNLLWNGHIRYGIVPNLGIGAITSRVPVSDSLLSWAGKTDLVTGQFYGMASQLWLGGYASWTPASTVDLGALLRGGWTEGYGIEVNPFVEAVGWAGVGMVNPRIEARFGAEGVVSSHDRQEDGFVLGQGGYFSPPLFTLVGPNAMVKAHFSGAKGVVCGGLFVGGQYVDGETTPWFGAGFTGVGRAGLGASARLSPTVSLGIDGRVQFTTDLWHQEAAVLHLDFGLQPGGPSAPTLTTVASPGAILPASADLCRVE